MLLTQRQARETMRDYALRTLKDNIIRLELSPGRMVSEKELSEKMGLSRGPVREALIELVKVKIVEVYPQRGSIIMPVDYDLVDEACFMRETLECAVAERCCRQDIAPEHLALLKENLKLQEARYRSQDRDKLWELDNEFHRLLFLTTNLMQIHTLMGSMLIHFDRVRAMSLSTVKDLKIVEDHRAILNAIEQRDAETAKQLMHTHLNRYQIDRDEISRQYPQHIKQSNN